MNNNNNNSNEIITRTFHIQLMYQCPDAWVWHVTAFCFHKQEQWQCVTRHMITVSRIITKNIRCTIISYQEGHGGRGHCYFFSMEQVLKSSFSIMKDIYYNTIYTKIYILNISVASLKTQSLIDLHFSWARKMLASFAQVTVTSDFNFIDKNPIKPIPFDSKHGSPNKDAKPIIIEN